MMKFPFSSLFTLGLLFLMIRERIRWIESSFATYSFSNSHNSPMLHDQTNYYSKNKPARNGNNKRNLALRVLYHFSSLLLFLLDRFLFITLNALFSQSSPFSIPSLEPAPLHRQTEAHNPHHSPSLWPPACFLLLHPGQSHPKPRLRTTFVSTMNPTNRPYNHRFFLDIASVSSFRGSNAVHSLFSLLLQFLQFLLFLFINCISLDPLNPHSLLASSVYQKPFPSQRSPSPRSIGRIPDPSPTERSPASLFYPSC